MAVGEARKRDRERARDEDARDAVQRADHGIGYAETLLDRG